MPHMEYLEERVSGFESVLNRESVLQMYYSCVSYRLNSSRRLYGGVYRGVLQCC